MPGIYIPDDLLVYATDEELLNYVRHLEAETHALEEWGYEPRQERAEKLCANGKVFETLYGGAVGGGKSDWILHHHYDLARRFPGFHGLLLRKKFPELRRSLIIRSWQKFDHTLGKYVSSDKEWRFDNGSIIEFGYLELDQDVHQYQSAEYDCVGWDELTEWPTDYPYTYMASRCRTTTDKMAMGLRPHMISGTNPGNVGGAWVKDRFVDLGPREKVHDVTVEIDGEEPRVTSRVFVPALLKDNRFIDRATYKLALANLRPALRKSLEEGNWDVVEGAFFELWDRQVHVIPPFEIPDWWARARGYDYGYAKPACWLWGAFDGDGTAYIYRELYGTGMTSQEQARQVKYRTGAEKIAYTQADPSIWAHTGIGPPIAQQLADAGIRGLRKASNARVDGWARVNNFLERDEQTGKPRVFVFSSCANLIRTLPMLVKDEDNPEDLDTDGEDHAADALRYLLMSRPGRSRAPKREPVTLEERMAAAQAERLRRKGTRGRLVDTPVGTVT